MISTSPLLDFDLVPAMEATAPPEARGLARDDVRLMVVYRSACRIEHRRFGALTEVLGAGDLLVVNTSATIPAALSGVTPAGPSMLHLSGRLEGSTVMAELRHRGPEAGATAPWLDATAGTTVELDGGGSATLLRPVAGARLPEVRLWETRLDLPVSLDAYLALNGRPIRYNHVASDWPLSAYQTVFATEPGSAEMPSAARPFTPELVTRLVARGVEIAPLLLHCGVSSHEAHEPPPRERFRVPAATAERVNATRRQGGRVIAVGTTVVRALETSVSEAGIALPADGWTDILVGPGRPPRLVDGILTGWHEPRASHLSMLEAFMGLDLLRTSYAAAREQGYLWHEFGDSHLLLP